MHRLLLSRCTNLRQDWVLQDHRSRTNSPAAPQKPFIRLQAPASPPSPVGPRNGHNGSNVRPMLGTTAH